jgi:hypothetical protein
MACLMGMSVFFPRVRFTCVVTAQTVPTVVRSLGIGELWQ